MCEAIWKLFPLWSGNGTKVWACDHISLDYHDRHRYYRHPRCLLSVFSLSKLFLQSLQWKPFSFFRKSIREKSLSGTSGSSSSFTISSTIACLNVWRLWIYDDTIQDQGKVNHDWDFAGKQVELVVFQGHKFIFLSLINDSNKVTSCLINLDGHYGIVNPETQAKILFLLEDDVGRHLERGHRRNSNVWGGVLLQIGRFWLYLLRGITVQKIQWHLCTGRSIRSDNWIGLTLICDVPQ